MEQQDVEYAGFWIRVGASLIDTMLLMAIIFPLLISIYGWDYFNPEKGLLAGVADFLISYVAPVVIRSKHRGPEPVRFEGR